MKKYQSVKGNTVMSFKNQESALKHVKENPDYIYNECNEWKYYDSMLRNKTTSFVTISGENIIEAIELSFEKIAESVGLGLYTLNSVILTDNYDGTATLSIKSWNTNSSKVGFEESLLSKENLQTTNLDITDIEDGDIPNGEIVFELIEK